MKIEALTVSLRPRSPWEAVELGSALLRQHASAVWTPWLLLSLPIFALLNATLWMLDTLWLAGLLMWWLKPWFDRIALHVLARAVFGDVPTWRQAIGAAFNRRLLLAHLTWRRLGPVRALYLPIDLLEGNDTGQARERRRVLGSPVYGVATLVTAMFANFEMVLALGIAALSALFIPQELLPETGQRVWELMQLQPRWMELAFNVVAWTATCVLEPFYIAAGFGLYLNRRTEIEAWDIELALRRLRTRLQAVATPALLLCALVTLAGAFPVQLRATPAPMPVIGAKVSTMPEAGKRPSAITTTPDAPATTAPIVPRGTMPSCQPAHRLARPLSEVFGKLMADDRDLRSATQRAYADPTLSPKRTITTWEPRNPAAPDKKDQRLPPWLVAFGLFMASVSEFLLWGVLAALVGVLVWTSPRWWPWLRNVVTAPEREWDDALHAAVAAQPEALPRDIPSAARALWQAGQARAALALLYRASVAAMVERIGTVLVPGATEAQCLRAAQHMPLAEDREVFARVVRTWQYLAYARQPPREAEFDALLSQASERFGWRP